MIKKVFINKYIFALIINIFVILGFLTFTNLYYDMADTVVFSEYISDGYYNIFFSNYLLCCLCGFLDNIIAPVNAYVLVQLILSFFAFYMLTLIFIEKFNKKVSLLIMLLIFSFFGVNHYSTSSFTLTPALLSCAGFLSLIHYINSPKNFWGEFAGFFLVCFSSLYRFEVFLLSLFVAGVFYISYSVSNIKLDMDKNTRKLYKLKKYFVLVFNKKFLIIFISLICVVLSMYGISKFSNNCTPELSYYSEYTTLRSNVYDYSIPSYDEAIEDYKKINISENDLKMLEMQYMDDEGAFSKENLRNIYLVGQKYKNISLFDTVYSMIRVELADILLAVTDKGTMIWLIVIFLFMYLLKMKKKNLIIPISLILCLLIAYLYLWVMSRPVYRALYPAGLSVAVFLVYSIDNNIEEDTINNKFYNSKVLKKIFYLTTIVFCIFITPLSFKCNLHKEKELNTSENGYYEMIDYMKNNDDKKFIFSKGSMVSNVDNYANPYLVLKPNKLTNTITFAGTYYRHPYCNQELKDFGTDNLFSYLINNESAYFVDSKSVNYAKYFETYLNEHYSNGKTIELKIANKVGNYNIYSVIAT